MKIETIKTINYNTKVSFIIEENTYDGCLAKFFKLNNQLKYCNGDSYSFVKDEDQKKYKKWFSLENYINNGGDMW